MSEGPQPYRSPYPIRSPPLRKFWVGLDLGQANDFTAISILEKQGRSLTVTYLERLKLGMSYPDQVNYVYSLMHRKPLAENAARLVCDYTGVGRPVVDSLRARGLDPIALSIHGGNAASWSQDRKSVRVPKRDLVNVLQVLAQGGLLKVSPKLRFGPTLVQELQNFRVKISDKSGHDSYNAREGTHDDLLLSVAIAAWTSENQPRPRAIARTLKVIPRS